MKDRHRAIAKIRRRRYNKYGLLGTKTSKVFVSEGITIALLAEKLGYGYFGTKKKTISQLKKKNKRW